MVRKLRDSLRRFRLKTGLLSALDEEIVELLIQQAEAISPVGSAYGVCWYACNGLTEADYLHINEIFRDEIREARYTEIELDAIVQNYLPGYLSIPVEYYTYAGTYFVPETTEVLG